MQLVDPHLPHRETVVDVLGAGLGHTGIRQVHFIKDQGLRGRNQSPSLPGREGSLPPPGLAGSGPPQTGHVGSTLQPTLASLA